MEKTINETKNEMRRGKESNCRGWGGNVERMEEIEDIWREGIKLVERRRKEREEKGRNLEMKGNQERVWKCKEMKMEREKMGKMNRKFGIDGIESRNKILGERNYGQSGERGRER